MTRLPDKPEALTQADDARKRLISRATTGVILIALLLGLLSYFERDARPPQKGPEAVGSTIPPIGPSPSGTGGDDVPASAALAPDAPPTVEQAALTVAAEPEESGAPEMAAPGTRVADAPASPGAGARPKGGRLVLQGEALAPEPDLGADAMPAPVVAAPAPTHSAPRNGFLLQLGVFSTSSNAQSLYDELQRRGIPARLETRVVAGPFENKAAAEAARKTLRAAGLSKGILVRDAASK